MFYDTVNFLMGRGFIKPDDLVVACMDSTAAASYWGGAIAASNAGRYILAANASGVTLFDVDKKTGQYLGTCIVLNKMNILKARVSGFLGSWTLFVKTTAHTYKLQSRSTFSGYPQKE